MIAKRKTKCTQCFSLNCRAYKNQLKKKERRLNLLKELLVEFPCDASPLSASSFELLRRDPDVLHVAAKHEINLGEQS